MTTLHQSAIELLEQLDVVLDELSDEQYTTSLEVLSGASLGQHYRHTLEFFVCLIDGRNDAVINYDLRKRDEIIETDKNLTQSLIASIKEFVTKQTSDFEVAFQANYSIDQEDLVSVKSSFNRELAYNIEHAIHHMALIKIGVRSLNHQIQLPKHFGVASSTVRFRLKDNH